jgi:hypothetical protein
MTRVVAGAVTLLGLCALCCFIQEKALSKEGPPPPGKVYYIVRQGDCLWDISQRFYKTPWVYPKVWRNNAYIANPHWIYPGDMILLARVPGEMEGAPAVEEVKESAAAAPGVTTLRVPRELADTAFLREGGVRGDGWVLASEDGRELSIQGDEVFLQLAGSSSEPGPGGYQILRSIRAVENPETGKNLGTLYAMVGSAEVIGTSGSQVARARILDSRDTVEPGDILHSGSPPPEEVYSKRANTRIKGNVVASLRLCEEIAQHDICFIDKGVLDGVEVGDSYWVYQRGRSVRGFGEAGDLDLPDTRVALLVVVHAEKTASTALVVEGRSTFSVGAPVESWVQ